MKKTLFLGAILGVALCSSAFATNYTAITADQTITTAAGDTIASLTMQNNSAFEIGGATTVNGNIIVGGTNSATITSSDTLLTFNGSRNYDLQLNGTSHMTLSGGTFDLTNASIGAAVNAGATLTVASGATLKTKDVMYSSSSAAKNGKIVVENGGILQIMSNNTYGDNYYTRLNDLVVSGTASISNADATVGNKNKAEIFNANIDGGSMSIEKMNVSITNLTFANSGTLTVNSGATLNLTSDSTWTGDETAVVARTEGNGYGVYAVSKNFGADSIVNNGTIKVDGVVATLSSEGEISGMKDASTDTTYYINDATQAATITRAGEISLNAGTYELSDKFVVGTNGAQAASATTLTVSGTTSVTTGNYMEVYHNSSLILNDTAHATVTNVNANKGLWIHNGATIQIAEGATLTVGTVDFKGGQITAKGDSQIGSGNYQAGNTTITGSDITVNGTTLAGHKVEGGSLTVKGTSTIGAVLSNNNQATNVTLADAAVATFTTSANIGTLTTSETAALALNANVAMTVNTTSDVTLSSVTLAAGSTIQLGAEDNGTLTTSAMTVNGNANINADLVFADNSTITFTAGSVTLGCSVTFGKNTTIALGTAYVEDMAANGQVLIFSGVDDLDLDNLKNVTVTIGDVTGILKAEVQNDGSYNIYATPEPATTTLSLLALAGLMARRKRH